MLGGERILDAQTAQAGSLGDLARKTTIGVEIAEHPAASMKKNDRGRGCSDSGIIDANPYGAARRGDRALLDMWHRRRASIRKKRQACVDPAQLGHGNQRRGRQALKASIDRPQDRALLRIERAPGRRKLGEESFGLRRKATESPPADAVLCSPAPPPCARESVPIVDSVATPALRALTNMRRDAVMRGLRSTD